MRKLVRRCDAREREAEDDGEDVEVDMVDKEHALLSSRDQTIAVRASRLSVSSRGDMKDGLAPD